MRGLTREVRPRHRLAPTLPALLQEDAFLTRFTAGLDDVLAPVVATLDSLDSYVDPALAPEDFLDWLAGWVALLEQRLALILESLQLARDTVVPVVGRSAEGHHRGTIRDGLP